MQEALAHVDVDELEKSKVYGIYSEYQGEPYKTAKELRIIDAIANSALLNYSFDIMQGHLKEEDDSYIITIGARAFWDSYFLARYKPVIAVDVVDDIRYINPNYAKGITRVVADGMYLPLKEDVASIIYMNATFHHMQDKARALRAWHRVLRPRGIVVASGEYYCKPEEKGSQDYIGEYSYTFEDFQQLMINSPFAIGTLFPVTYCENMEYKMGIELTGKVCNGIIVLVKG
ncbi:MAG: class I SAM-dependent methyltransferase [Gammaproteobacteria bacterium]|nr:class I SAM-dependent methyltransferase [Gammaproteobacteria bacterium]